MSGQGNPTAAGPGDRPGHDIGLGSMHAKKVDVDRRQAFESNALIPDERDGLEENLRQHDGGTAIQVDPPAKLRDRRRKKPKIAKTRFTYRRP